MEQQFPRSVADEWDALRDAASLRRQPRPPRGELTEGELRDYLRLLGSEMYRARSKAGLTQAQVALMMDTSKSAVSRLERLGPSVPSITTLCRYANAIDCRLQIRLVSMSPEAERPGWSGQEGEE